MDTRALHVCPHCWGVNPYSERLCGRCGADMTLLLQESGGMRWAAPVQSPVPVRAASRLSVLQRGLVLVFVALLALSWLAAAAAPPMVQAPRPAAPIGS